MRYLPCKPLDRQHKPYRSVDPPATPSENSVLHLPKTRRQLRLGRSWGDTLGILIVIPRVLEYMKHVEDVRLTGGTVNSFRASVSAVWSAT